MKYVGVQAIDFTTNPATVHGIALNADGIYNESTKIPYLNTNAFFRVARIDGSLYMYLSVEEVSADKILDEVKELVIQPL